MPLHIAAVERNSQRQLETASLDISKLRTLISAFHGIGLGRKENEETGYEISYMYKSIDYDSLFDIEAEYLKIKREEMWNHETSLHLNEIITTTSGRKQ